VEYFCKRGWTGEGIGFESAHEFQRAMTDASQLITRNGVNSRNTMRTKLLTIGLFLLALIFPLSSGLAALSQHFPNLPFRSGLNRLLRGLNGLMSFNHGRFIRN
jgi:hypothetical protein